MAAAMHHETAAFALVPLWQLKDGNWKLTRVVSCGHR
jgi:hypothetical protein